MKSYRTTKKRTGVGEKLHLPDCLLGCSFGETNKFTIEKLNSSRSAFAEKKGERQRSSRIYSALCVWCLASYRYLDYPPLQLALKDKIMPRLIVKPIIAPSQ